ncbi:MAG TPA: ABC transporter substrate-binding protein [Salinarimonas sp.]|nr:ABC transporter substrate-binding protein [Salinarimonas sp.]
MRALLVAPLLLLAGAALAGDPPRRVASMNLCTDGLLLALADPEQVASLSPLAGDPTLSFMAERAAAHPVNAGRGEAMLMGDADLVLAGPFEGRARRDMLRRLGFEVMTLGLWTNLAEGRDQIRALARRLGRPERGEALVARIDAALERARGAAPAPRTVLALQRRGYTPGDTTILDEILRHMGLVPHAPRLGVPHGGTVTLERLVAAPPDYILSGSGEAEAVDQGSAFLVHPALIRLVPPERRLALPGRLGICGGPSTPDMIDALAAEVRAKVR